MRLRRSAFLLALPLSALCAGSVGRATADRWWSHVTFLADDALQGRHTGSEGYRKAAAYVAAEFEKAGLKPAGVNGFLQPVKFRSRRIVEEKSSLAIVRNNNVEPVALGPEATFSMRVDPAPKIEAPIVFVGYGLKVPELDYDDFAGLDLRGKVVLLLTGGPVTMPGPLLAHYQSVRWSTLKPTGAIGVLSITNPKGMDIPWDRNVLSRFQPSLTLADPALDETAGQRLAVTLNPARVEKFFAGSGHSFEEILALANEGKRLPRFAIPASVRASVTVAAEELESANVAGVLPGSDPTLKNEVVALSAHLDHMGVGEPIRGDRIYNGAMDNASGVATLLETAAAIREARGTFKRSLLFVTVTGEEQGLLGSRYFAAHPPAAAGQLVADVNVDMFLPLFPLHSVIVQGLEESDLARDLRQVSQARGIEVLSDPEPERNAFTRSDQYSFIRRGIPSVSLKVGFAKGSAEHEIVKRWRTERYHAPSDDLSQPIDLKAAEDFNRLYLLLVEAIASRSERPRWNDDSFFRRFAAQPPNTRAAASPAAAFDVMEQSIEELQRAMRDGAVTSRQLVDAYLARIDAYDKQGPALNAIARTNPRARDAADALDAERRAGRVRGPLHGIPVVVKDNYETIEMPTSAGSIALATFHPARDAFQVQRLRAAGAVVLGKTNMHELAAGIVTLGSGFGRTKNPYDLDRNPGGSSGGTGAAVAANFAVSGMGSDTCGSIRNPSSHNNLVGLRGTQGLSSRTGIVPLSSTQDIGGPLARTIPDLAIMLDATVGEDPADASTSASAGHIPPSYRAALRADAVKGARIGVVRLLFGDAPEDREVAATVQKALDALKKSGAELIDVVIPGLNELLRDSSMINFDFKFDLAEYLATAPDPPVRSLGEILDRGLFHTALESSFRTRNAVEQRENEGSRRARIKRTALRQAVQAVLAEHRLAALVYPTLRRKPARLGDAQAGSNCQLSAHSGLPALGLPAGFTDDGVPVGMDLVGDAFTEQELLSLGYSIEQTLKLRRAPFSMPPLVNGKRPEPRATTVTFNARSVSAKLNLVYDETTSRLDYVLAVDPAGRDRISAVWIHGGTVEKPAGARHPLFVGGQATSGTVLLSMADRRDLADGRLLIRFFLRDTRGSAGDVPLSFSKAASNN